MVEVLVMAVVVVVLFAFVCIWLYHLSNLIGKLLYEEKRRNVQLTMENEFYLEKLAEFEQQHQQNDFTNQKASSLEVVDSLPYWGDEVDDGDEYESVDYRPKKDNSEEFPPHDSPIQDSNQFFDDLLENYKKDFGYYPGEYKSDGYAEEIKDNQVFYPSDYDLDNLFKVKEPLEDDLFESFKKLTGYYPWEHPNQHNNNGTSEYVPDNPVKDFEFPLYDDPIIQYKATQGFLPWEWEEFEEKEQI